MKKFRIEKIRNFFIYQPVEKGHRKVAFFS